MPLSPCAPTGLFQGVSLLEVLHAALGLVPSSPLMAAMQWAGRSHVLFVVLGGVAESRALVFAPVLLAAWALSEVIR